MERDTFAMPHNSMAPQAVLMLAWLPTIKLVALRRTAADAAPLALFQGLEALLGLRALLLLVHAHHADQADLALDRRAVRPVRDRRRSRHRRLPVAVRVVAGRGAIHECCDVGPEKPGET